MPAGVDPIAVALREAVAAWAVETQGVRYPIESVLISSGFRPLLSAAFTAVVNPGDQPRGLARVDQTADDHGAVGANRAGELGGGQVRRLDRRHPVVFYSRSGRNRLRVGRRVGVAAELGERTVAQVDELLLGGG